jgi:hypothetical protein
MPMVDACYLEASQRPLFERAARGPPPPTLRNHPCPRAACRLAGSTPVGYGELIEQLELPDLEDPLAYLLGRYRSVGDLPDHG